MPATLTRRHLIAGAARLAAGAALAGAGAVCSSLRRRARRRRTGAAGLTEAGYWAFVDPIAERMDHLWDAGTAATASAARRSRPSTPRC